MWKIYFAQECKIEGHSEEFLDRVCVEKSCDKRGLICEICRIQIHSKCKIITIQKFLSQFKQQVNLIQDDQLECDKQLKELETLQNQNKETFLIINQFFEETANKFQLLTNKVIQTYNRKEQLNAKLQNFISDSTIDKFEQLFKEIELQNNNKDLFTFSIKQISSNQISQMQKNIQELSQQLKQNNLHLNNFNQYQAQINTLLDSYLQKKETICQQNQMIQEQAVQQINQQNCSSKTQELVSETKSKKKAIQLSSKLKYQQSQQNLQGQFCQQLKQIKLEHQSPEPDLDIIFTQIEMWEDDKKKTLQEYQQIKQQDQNQIISALIQSSTQQTTLNVQQQSSLKDTSEFEVVPLIINELKLQIKSIIDNKEIKSVVPIQNDIYLFTTQKEFFLIDLIQQRKSQIEKLDEKISSIENIFLDNQSILILATKNGIIYEYEYDMTLNKIKLIRFQNLLNVKGRLLIAKIKNQLVTIGGDNCLKIYSYPDYHLIEEVKKISPKPPKLLLVHDQEVFIAGNKFVSIIYSTKQIQQLDNILEQPKCLDFKNDQLLIVYSQEIIIYEKIQNTYEVKWKHRFQQEEIQICKFITFSPLLFINIKQQQYGYEQFSGQFYENKLEMQRIDTKNILVHVIENLQTQFIIIAQQHDNKILQIKFTTD